MEIPKSGRSPGEGNGNSLQYSSLENSMDSLMGYQSMGSQRVPLERQLSQDNKNVVRRCSGDKLRLKYVHEAIDPSLRGTPGSSLRSPAEGEGNEGFPPGSPVHGIFQA